MSSMSSLRTCFTTRAWIPYAFASHCYSVVFCRLPWPFWSPVVSRGFLAHISLPFRPLLFLYYLLVLSRGLPVAQPSSNVGLLVANLMFLKSTTSAIV